MTLREFRSNPVLVAAMRELIGVSGQEPTVLAQAIVAVQSDRLILDAKDDQPDIVSVRLLSRAAERQDVISDLLSCAEPLPIEQQEEKPTFGINPAEFQQELPTL